MSANETTPSKSQFIKVNHLRSSYRLQHGDLYIIIYNFYVIIRYSLSHLWLTPLRYEKTKSKFIHTNHQQMETLLARFKQH